MEDTHFESLYPENSRLEEVKRVVEYVKQGNSCQTVGLPGIGRSNLLRLLAYNRNVRLKHLGENQKWFHFVMVDFSEIRRRTILDATKFLFLSLVDSLRERRMEEEYLKVNDIFKESISFKDELVLFQGLKKAVDYLAIEKELTIVLLFDRFEEYVPMLTPEFFSNLRTLRNRAKYRFSVVFSLNRPLEDLLEPLLFADFYEFLAGHIIYLSIFDKPVMDFRIAYLEKITEKTIGKLLLGKVLELSGSHGKITRLSLEAILAQGVIPMKMGIYTNNALDSRFRGNDNREGGNDKGRSDNKLESFLLSQKPVIGALYEIWNSLTPAEQNLLSNVIAKTPSLRDHEMAKQSTIKDEIASSSFDKLRTPRNDEIYLTNAGLIKDDKITIPLFEEFVKSKLAIQQFSNLTIAFDSNTNEIKKGDIVLSDQLTSSEYRLLRFLIINKDKVVNREEIINAVWQDSKTTAGVTDQAVDQLIFRLRKKIESDPNNPKHIQTVKGRGIRFIL